MSARRRRPRHRLKEISYCTIVGLVLAVTVVSGVRIVRQAAGQSAWAATGRSQVLALATSTPSASPAAVGTSVPATSPPRSASGDLNVYAAATSTTVRADLARIPERVYVPNSLAGTLDVIDPKSYTVVGHLQTGQIPTTSRRRGI